MVSLYNCWTCDRRLDPEETIEEYFFWCNKECYDKDDRYHNREKLVNQNQRLQLQIKKMRKSAENLKYVQLLLKSMDHVRIEDLQNIKKDKEN